MSSGYRWTGCETGTRDRAHPTGCCCNFCRNDRHAAASDYRASGGSSRWPFSTLHLAENSGNDNTALGTAALQVYTAGDNNIAIGSAAGLSITTGDNNILIGSAGSSSDGTTTDNDVIRIGTDQDKTFIAVIFDTNVSSSEYVVIKSNGQLGSITASSRNLKEDIRDVGEHSAALLELRPVLFRYRGDGTETGRHRLQPGLIAEEVAEVLPEIVRFDASGKPIGVRYNYLSTLLVNELQKQDRKVERLERLLLALAPAFMLFVGLVTWQLGRR